MFKLLYLSSEIILSLNAFFWLAIGFPVFSSIIALFASWKLLELLYIGPEHKLRTVQDLNRALPATFRTQIEQIRTHFEQPQKKFKTKWKFELFLSLSLRNLSASGEPAISHDVSLVQWTTCLLPATRDSGSNPQGGLMWNRDSPVSVVSQHWWPRRDPITGFVSLKVLH